VAFNLQDVIQHELDTTSIADPVELAANLLKGPIPKQRYAEVLALTLPGYVREIIRMDRMAVLDAPNRSGHKNASARQANLSILTQRWHTGERWVILADMTRLDVQDVLAEYQRRMNEQAKFVTRWTEVDHLFDIHKKAKTCRDLPVPELERIFSS
jgi:hypothetical protein